VIPVEQERIRRVVGKKREEKLKAEKKKNPKK